MSIAHRIAGLAVAGLLCATSAFAQAPSGFPDLAKYRGADRDKVLLDGARKEGSVVFYTSIVKDMIDKLSAGFEKKYPGVKVETTVLTDNAAGTRVITEYQSGRYAVDLISVAGTGPSIVAAVGGQDWSSPYLDPYPVGDAGKDASGLYVTMTLYPRTFAYNTSLVAPKDVPTKWEDLLSPRWKGKMVISTANTMGPLIVGGLIDAWGRDRALDYLTKLGAIDITALPVTAIAVANQVASGEFDACFCAIHHITGLQRAGAPVAFSVLGDTLFTPVQTLQLPKQPPHPHAALLFADYLVSEEGAQIQKANGYFPTHPKVAATNAELAKYKQWVLTPERLDTGVPQWVEIMKRFVRMKN